MLSLILCLTILSGSPAIRASVLRPYRNLWNVQIRTKEGRDIDWGTWSDQLESRADGMLVRTQIARRTSGDQETRTTNVFDPHTLAPVRSERQGNSKTQLTRTFEDREITTTRTAPDGHET